jgi:transcription elongation factor Elf1
MNNKKKRKRLATKLCCPHCHWVDNEWLDHLGTPDRIRKIPCFNCGKMFEACFHETITFETWKELSPL